MQEVKKEVVKSKVATRKNNFYLPILNLLKTTTNLSKIQTELAITKQNLNYYLRQLKKRGLVSNTSLGLWELTNDGKNPTKYGSLLDKDICRGHGVIVSIKLPKEIEGWENRKDLLEKKQINHKLVGAKLDVPRIKVLGRKVWLCKDKIRIFDLKDNSYYANNAVQSRVMAFNEFKKIVSVIENKLGIRLNPTDINFVREHFALIKNDLAIEENKRGNIIRISDENGEWLVIDDSLGKGGELETIGKKALVTNVPMQKWWNENKEDKFYWSSLRIGQGFAQTNNMIQQVTQNQLMFNQNFESHVEAIRTLSQTVKELREEIRNLKNLK